MIASQLHLMWAQLQLIWARVPFQLQLIWAENSLDCKPKRLCLQAATNIDNNVQDDLIQQFTVALQKKQNPQSENR